MPNIGIFKLRLTLFRTGHDQVELIGSTPLLCKGKTSPVGGAAENPVIWQLDLVGSSLVHFLKYRRGE